MEDLKPGDIIVRNRHGRWMADVVGGEHSGGWSDPASAVRRAIRDTTLPRPWWKLFQPRP